MCRACHGVFSIVARSNRLVAIAHDDDHGVWSASKSLTLEWNRSWINPITVQGQNFSRRRRARKRATCWGFTAWRRETGRVHLNHKRRCLPQGMGDVSIWGHQKIIVFFPLDNTIVVLISPLAQYDVLNAQIMAQILNQHLCWTPSLFEFIKGASQVSTGT